MEIRIKFFDDLFKNHIFGGVGVPLPIFATFRIPLLAKFDMIPCFDPHEIEKSAPLGAVLFHEKTDAKNRKSLSLTVFKLGLVTLTPNMLKVQKMHDPVL